ncbi:MAG: protein translocase subunit SecF [Ignavibacteria bacterium]|nr:protein translocase subunit SecF [Ignavibacteria bacterium]
MVLVRLVLVNLNLKPLDTGEHTMQFLHGTKIDFLGKRKTFIYLSLILNVVGILAPFVLGLRFGIDFEGGTEIALQFSEKINTAEIRDVIDKQFEGAEIKSYGKENQFLIRVVTNLSKDATSQVIQTLKDKYPTEVITILKVDTIGPKVGNELRTKALIAVLLAIIAIMLYIAFRFEFTYGVGAAIAIVHDVLVTLALVTVFSKLGILNLEVNQSMIAAFLTVVGFSVNDTVIIFDRIRENIERHKGMNMIKLMNISINETLSRTINTVLTVVMVLFIITLFGGEVLQGFSFTMLVGIITGAYSSIYIASAFVIWYLQHVKKVDVEGDFTRQNNTELLKASKV